MKTLFTLTLFMSISLSYGQESLNQLDTSGKTHGKWIVYLDKDWKKVDSSKAVFSRYTWFDHGVNIYPMGPCGGKGYKLEQPDTGETPYVSPMDGTYKWYDSKDRLSSEHIFKNGVYVSCKEYLRTGELSQHFDFTKKCEGQEHGWTVYIYDKKGNIVQALPTCRNKNGKWPVMRG
jgi:antitoxin component YwqK of YwqJK toxin-antitoxin module